MRQIARPRQRLWLKNRAVPCSPELARSIESPPRRFYTHHFLLLCPPRLGLPALRSVVQFAGSGNSAILRNISASRTRVRCPSASISQSYCACFASRPPVFTNLCCRLVRDQSFIALLRFYGNAWLKGHFSKPLCPPVTSLTKSTVSRAHFCCFSFAQAHRLQRIGAAFHASAMSRRSRSCSSTARIYLRRGQAKQASWALRPR